ncbi:subtilase family protein [Mycobacterium xenopi 4042]|uniref:Subtilase family protein n=1 Tax=Mycobacterium xenopi 4042 TaxID=1299334 RepID=X8A065_MYCXE|nr:subtilase family protein [Mycobacterium xenopi 4042]
MGRRRAVGGLGDQRRRALHVQPARTLARVAAPGETITSVGNYPDGHLVNGLPGKDGPLVPIYGTSFAAAYVSGVAALVRQKYPELNAYQVINRIKSTAHAGPAPTDPAVGWVWSIRWPR